VRIATAAATAATATQPMAPAQRSKAQVFCGICVILGMAALSIIGIKVFFT
jgi:hypothetical protein